MKHTDEHIRKIFSDKLGDFESPVPDALWHEVSSKLPASVGTTSGITAGFAKWIAAAILTVSSAVVVFYVSEKEEAPSNAAAVQSTSTTAAGQQLAITETTPESNANSDGPIGAVQSDAVVVRQDQNSTGHFTNSGTDHTSHGQLNSKHKSVSGPMGEVLVDDSERGVTSNRDLSAGLEPVETSTTVEVKLDASFAVVPIDKESRIYFFMPSETSANKYHWNFGDGEISDLMSPQHAFEVEGMYQVVLTITEEGGESASVSQECNVIVPGKITIPKNVIITPNGDGLNDEFDVIAYSEGIEFQKIQIRNSAGDIIYESDGSQMWFGKDLSGIECPTGYYQYLVRGIDRNQEIREKRGIVYLQK